METIISIRGIGKKYRISHKNIRYATLRDIVAYAIKSPLQHAKNQTRKMLGGETKEEFWALKNLNLDIKKGEVVGVIGKNGAGKSTLLKILTGITPPTTGEIRIKGKVASLLEVGTGFHPELSGRENIYLNGAILGMTKREIEKKFDQIVEFSGIGKFLDTPVKRYSSGMYVRLAFSVAAHLEPDILLVDEVLAVGDAEFQKKCLGKMDEVTKTAGRTILFVSHNMDAISRLCKKTVLLHEGSVVMFDDTDKVIARYLQTRQQTDPATRFPVTDEDVTVRAFSVSQDGKQTQEIAGEKPITINIDFSVARRLQSFRVGVFVKNSLGTVITRSFIQDWNQEMENMESGAYSANLTVPERLLRPGEYQVELKIFCLGTRGYFENQHIEKDITVYSPKNFNEMRSKNTTTRGYFLIPTEWNLKRNG